jgi:hypothetical protein
MSWPEHRGHVIGYLILVLIAAFTLTGDRRPAWVGWVGWVELSLVPALFYVVAWSFQDMRAHNGAPEFYLSIVGLAVAGAAFAGLAAVRVLRRKIA